MDNNITSKELNMIIDRIIKGEISLREATKIYGMPRTTLTRKIEKELQKDEMRYDEYKKVIAKNHVSGGVLEETNKNIYGKPSEIKKFYLNYSQEKRKGILDKEIIQNMGINKATFYRKKKAYKSYLKEGTISFNSKELKLLTNEEKEEVLINKLRRRYIQLEDNPLKEEECKSRIKNLKAYLIEREKENKTEVKIDEDYIYSIINGNIDLIRLSLDGKIKPNIENIENLVGKKMTNNILINKPFLLSFSKKRIEELISIAKKYNKLEIYVKSSDRSSPELLNALLAVAEEKNLKFKSICQINKYIKSNGIKKELILEKYPYKKKKNWIGSTFKGEKEER